MNILNFSKPRKRAPEAGLYSLRGLLPQNVPDTTQPDDDVFDTNACRKAESAGNGELPSGEKNFSVHKTYMNFSRPRQRSPEAVLYDLRGRSMVEMLGVLAIIGVLSVGAIAGYQKAMLKYRLNKHLQAVNLLINNGLQINSKLPVYENLTNHSELFNSLGLIPESMIFSKPNIKDNFDNVITVYSAPPSWGYKMGIALTLRKSPYDFEVCKNFIIAAKENSQNLYLLERYNDSESTYAGHLWGDNYCPKSKNCLKNLTLDNINALCQVAENSRDPFYVLRK